jgi:hypothetical protein
VAKPLDINDEPLEITEEPSDLHEWVDDYTAEDDGDDEEDHESIGDKLDNVLDILNQLKDSGDLNPRDKSEEYDPVQKQDHDAAEDSYWDRTLKPNPMAMDNEFGSGEYNERNDGALPGGRAMAAKVAKDCGCWDGYKRVPGTKPCAPGSCEKCDAGRKESAANPLQSLEEVAKRIDRDWQHAPRDDGFKRVPVFQNAFNQFNNFQNIYTPEAQNLFNQIVSAIKRIASEAGGDFSRDERSYFETAAMQASEG